MHKDGIPFLWHHFVFFYTSTYWVDVLLLAMVVCGCYAHNESAFLLSENGWLEVSNSRLEDVVCSSTLPEYVSLLQDTSSSLSKLEALPAITQEAKAVPINFVFHCSVCPVWEIRRN